MTNYILTLICHTTNWTNENRFIGAQSWLKATQDHRIQTGDGTLFLGFSSCEFRKLGAWLLRSRYARNNSHSIEIVSLVEFAECRLDLDPTQTFRTISPYEQRFCINQIFLPTALISGKSKYSKTRILGNRKPDQIIRTIVVRFEFEYSTRLFFPSPQSSPKKI